MNSPIRNTPMETARLTASRPSTSASGIGITIISTMPMIPSGISTSLAELEATAGFGADCTATVLRIPCHSHLVGIYPTEAASAVVSSNTSDRPVSAPWQDATALTLARGHGGGVPHRLS